MRRSVGGGALLEWQRDGCRILTKRDWLGLAAVTQLQMTALTSPSFCLLRERSGSKGLQWAGGSMPTYRFTIGDGTSETWSGDVVAADLEGAQISALRSASDLLANMDAAFWENGHLQLDVSDEDGLALCAIIVTAIEAPVVARQRKPFAGFSV